MNRVAIYIIGALLLTGGLGYAAHLLGAPNQWIGVGAVIILGLGVMGAASSAKSSSNTSVNVDEG